MSDQPKRIIDEFFQEYDARTRDWLLETLKEELAGLGAPVSDLKSLEDYNRYLESLDRVIYSSDGECELLISGCTKKESIKIAKKIYPKMVLVYTLMSPVTDENYHQLINKSFTEDLSSIRRFLKELWPRNKKKRRKIEVEREWLKTIE